MNNVKLVSQEEWKIIDGTDGKYEVSNQGMVRNAITLHVLKLQDKHGYKRLNLRINGKDKNCAVHRLVAKAFIPNPERKPEVNHKDGVHDNNNVANLEWVTPEENFRHAVDNDLFRKGVERAKANGGSNGYNRKDKPKAYLRKSEIITKSGYEYLLSKAEECGCTIQTFPQYYENKIKIQQSENDRLIKNLIKVIQDRDNAVRKILDYKLQDEWKSNMAPIGTKQHYLTIVGYWKDAKTNNRYYICKCDCGKHYMLPQGLFGKTKSCGCVQMQKKADPKKQDWLCSLWNRQHRKPEWCAEWEDYDAFYEWSYKNGYSFGKHLHRIDFARGFSPDNCEWKDKMQIVPSSRLRRNVRKYECNGETLSLPEICEKYGLSSQFLTYRLKRGMSMNEAVNTPKCTNGRKSNANHLVV